MNAVLTKAVKTVQTHHLVKPGEKVVVACSGGPDSVFLVHLFAHLKPLMFLDVAVAHLNHSLRGAESDADEQFTQDLAGQLELPFYARKVDVAALAEKEHLSLEACGRNERYCFFSELAEQLNAEKIATGHTADDQAETVLMHLLRGAGSRGLAGMPLLRGKIIRPLLHLSKKEILAYLESQKIQYRIDRTNEKTDFLRNKIRHHLMPLLEQEYNPSITAALGRTAEILEQQENYLEWFAQEAVEDCLVSSGEEAVILDSGRFLNYDPVIQRLVVRSVWQKLTGSAFGLGFETVRRVIDDANGQSRLAPLGSRFWVEHTGTQLIFFKKVTQRVEHSVVLPGSYSWGNPPLSLVAEVVEREGIDLFVNGDPAVAYFDWDRLTPPFVLRSVKPGDRFAPLGMGGQKKVGDFFTDLKIPRYQRAKSLVLTSNGEVVWLVGYRISDRFKVTIQTRRVLKAIVRDGLFAPKGKTHPADYIQQGFTKAG